MFLFELGWKKLTELSRARVSFYRFCNGGYMYPVPYIPSYMMLTSLNKYDCAGNPPGHPTPLPVLKTLHS